MTTLDRTTFRTSRLLEFCSQKELVAQTGHRPAAWPLVTAKELVDNALDACEEAGVAPEIEIVVDDGSITVQDNGPGLDAETIAGVLDFTVRVSSREAYVAPDRGAQGNALKTIVAMPFVLDGDRGRVDIVSQGLRHAIEMRVDQIRQQPVIDHAIEESDVRIGTAVTVSWPDSSSPILADAKERFLHFAAAYSWLNPHLALTTDWLGERADIAATDPAWRKWLPSNPTSPHWYSVEHLERLIAAYVAHDADHDRDRTVRELVREFRGLTGTAKQKAVLDATGLTRTTLSGLLVGDRLDRDLVGRLLEAMKMHSKPVKPTALGLIGQDHLRQRFEVAGCEMESFSYRKATGETDGMPWIVETAFGWCPDAGDRRLVTGVNWSPGILNPFRELGKFGRSLDAILEQQRAGDDEPVALVLHLACPRVEYTDRGKSAAVIGGAD